MLVYLKRICYEETDSTVLQIIRYLFVGGISFVVDYAILFLLKEYCAVNYLIAAAFAFCGGVVANFVFTKLLVFKTVLQNKVRERAIFFLICAAGLIYTELIMYCLTDLLGIHYLLSKIVATIIVFFWNFFAKKLILYKTQKASV